jgi:hypothetical protein
MRVQSGTAAVAAQRYSGIMRLEDMKLAVVIAWALVLGVVAISLVSSISSWILVVGSGVLPPLMLLRMWHPAVRPLPVGISEARR